MKITAVKSYVLTAPMPKPLRIGGHTFEKGYSTLVEITTDEGITGVGEAIARLGPGAPKAIIDEVLGPAILGSDPTAVEARWDEMFRLMRYRGHSRGYFMEAMSGVDMALWDIAGKAHELPIYRLMLGCNRLEVPCYASSIFWDSPANMASTAGKLVKKGYKAMKVKIGQGVETDIECLREIRREVGSEVDLMVDANCVYSCADAVRVGRKLEELNIRWFEEPLPPDDLDGYKILAAKLDVPLAAGEAEFSIYGVRGLLESGVRLIQPDVARAGGITESRKIAALAQAFHAFYCPHCGITSALPMAASLHLAASVPNFLIYESIAEEHPIHKNILKEPLPAPRKSMAKVPQGPGLGVELDWKAVKEYCTA